jgi:Winged helix DNA-binding domain
MDPVLSRRALNRALLARQLLLERSPAPLPRALERVGGIQAQYAPSMYFGLWSRLRDLDPAAITRGLERRSLVQATLMRSTIHLVSRGDYWPLALAVGDVRRRSWTRSVKGDEAAMRRAAARLREALRDGPLRRAEIEALIGKEEARWAGFFLDLVRVPPSGTWERRRADLYAAAEDWLGPPETTAEAGRELLATRYLRAFGPASRADMTNFTGFTPAEVDAALAGVELRRFRSEDGTELLDAPRAPLPVPDTPAPPRLIPTWDAILLVHARRTGVLPEEHRPRIFSTRTPHSFPTFLVDGAVAGTWREERGRIALEPFGRLDAADRRALEAEAERLAAVFWGG